MNRVLNALRTSSTPWTSMADISVSDRALAAIFARYDTIPGTNSLTQDCTETRPLAAAAMSVFEQWAAVMRT